MAAITGGSFDSTTLTGIKNKTLPMIAKKLHNAVYTDIAYLKMMDKLGGVERNQTGEGVVVKVLKSKNNTFTARYLRSAYPLVGQDTHRMGFQDYGEYSGDYVIDFVSQQKNSGPEAMIDYVKQEAEELIKTAKDSINTALLSGSGSSPAILGIDSLIPETVSTGTLHGINRATATWWRPTATDSACSTTDGAGLINIKEVDKLIKDISEGQGMNPINMAVTDLTTHNNLTYYGLAVQNSRFLIANGGNAPATGVDFKHDTILTVGGAPLIWDSNSPSDSLRVFSTDNVKIHILKNCDFKVLEAKWAEDSFSKNIPVGVVLAHINHNPKRSGVLYNFTA